MNKSPAFQLYPADWLSSMTVTMMTPAQEGAYIRLICYDWSNDGIPDDDNQLSSLSRLGEGWFKGGSTVVRKCFKQHPTKEGFLTNDRLEKEREKQRTWREKSSEGGKKSAETRKNKGKDGFKGGSTTVSRVVQPNGNIISSSSSMFSNNTPNPLQGDIDIDLIPKELTEKDMIPANVSRMRAKQKGMMRVTGNTPTMARIGSWFRRGQKTLWSVAELESFLIVNPTPQEINGMEQLYTDKDLDPAKFGYRRQSLITLLNNWHQELDNARKYAEHLESKTNQ